jgi:AAA+ ATPase superfamily predicted ATPase
MTAIVGREKERKLFEELLVSDKSEFIAVYGRRRVGKTFLIRSALGQQFAFQMTGLANASLTQQLNNFSVALQKVATGFEGAATQDWFTAFQQLSQYLETVSSAKKVVFLDEMPWLDTPKSGFVQALEHFWNSWASARTDIILVVCGSAASWMINKLIHNKGGLHNRVTRRLKIVPFTLHECELFLQEKKTPLDRYQTIQLYMALGGIPYYWDQIIPGQSAAQNIEAICFTENGLLRTEFSNLFSSLFTNWEKHLAIITALASKSKGLTREEIITISGLPNGGGVTRLLVELEESGFIRKYIPFAKKQRNSLYQLVDFYSLFYLKFIKDSQLTDENNWINSIDSPAHRAWAGYAFEQVCLYHLPQIKQALGISGIQTSASSWRSNDAKQGAQIDLVIDRRDHVINLCEMKYSINPYVIDKKYADELRNKTGTFKTETNTRKSVFLTMVTSFGMQPNMHSIGLVQNSITMDALFEA